MESSIPFQFRSIPFCNSNSNSMADNDNLPEGQNWTGKKQNKPKQNKKNPEAPITKLIVT